MSGIDSGQQNTRERWLSSFVNDIQSLAGRVLMEMQRFSQAARVLATPGETVVNVVLGGLVVVPSGNNVSVGAGELLQDSGSILPAPGPLVSTYRLSRNASATDVVMPSPGGTTFYLVEAQCIQNITLTQNVDIWNESTQSFDSTAETKRLENQVEFQVIAGGANAPAPSGGDWVPLAIVRRPGGGGAVAASDIIDVRRLAEYGRQRSTKPAKTIDRALVSGTPNPTTRVQVFSQIDGPGGLRTFELLTSGAGSEDMASARFVSPSVAFAALTKYYLYLAPWSALGLSPRYADANDSFEGVLVLSDGGPTGSGRNVASIQLPAPYGVLDAPAQSAYYVCTLIRNAANTGFLAMQHADGFTKFWSFAAVAGTLGTTYAPPGGGLTFNMDKVSPRARFVTLHMSYIGAGSANVVAVAIVDPTSTVNFGILKFYDDALEASVQEVEIPWEQSTTLTLNCTGAINAGSTLTVSVIGWRE